MAAPSHQYKLTVGRLVGDGIRIYARNLLPFVALATVVLLPWIALRIYQSTVEGRATPTEALWLGLASLVLQSLLTYVLTGAVTYGVVQQLRGEPASFASAFTKGLATFLRTLTTGLLCGVRIFLFTLLLIVPGIIESLRLFVAIPAAVMEGKQGADAVRRSQTLTRGSLGPLFGAWIVGYVVPVVVIGMIAGLVVVAMGGAERGSDPTMPAWFDIAVAVLISTFAATLAAVAYFLLRMGKENVDVKAIAAVFD